MAEWLRTNEERRRQALIRSQEQRRPALDKLAQQGLRPMMLHELIDDLAELTPMEMWG